MQYLVIFQELPIQLKYNCEPYQFICSAYTQEEGLLWDGQVTSCLLSILICIISDLDISIIPVCRCVGMSLCIGTGVLVDQCTSSYCTCTAVL